MNEHLELHEGDTVIIAKGSETIQVLPGSIGKVVGIKLAHGSKLVPGQDHQTQTVQFATVDINGKLYLFGPVDNPLSKVDESCTTADRIQLLRDLASAKRIADQSETKYLETKLQAEALEASITDSLKRVHTLTGQITRLSTMDEINRRSTSALRIRSLQNALRYRRGWQKARAELVELSTALSSKDVEMQQMRANIQLANDMHTSTEKAAGETEGYAGRLELKVKSLEADLRRAQQDNESIAATAKRPQVAAESLLHQLGYTGGLLDMVQALSHDRDVAQTAFNKVIAAQSEPGKITIVDFAGDQPATAVELPPAG